MIGSCNYSHKLRGNSDRDSRRGGMGVSKGKKTGVRRGRGFERGALSGWLFLIFLPRAVLWVCFM